MPVGKAYWFVRTQTTYDVSVPLTATNQANFNRDVSNAFYAMTGGYGNAGDALYRVSPKAVPNYLLCDGQTLNSVAYPQLFDALVQGGWATPGAATFTLPTQAQMAGLIATPPPTPPQVVEGGTVTSGSTPTQPTQPGQTGGTVGGPVDSGGRAPKRQLD